LADTSCEPAFTASVSDTDRLAGGSGFLSQKMFAAVRDGFGLKPSETGTALPYCMVYPIVRAPDQAENGNGPV
jgi:hypothetical protein